MTERQFNDSPATNEADNCEEGFISTPLSADDVFDRQGDFSPRASARQQEYEVSIPQLIQFWEKLFPHNGLRGSAEVQSLGEINL